MMMMMASLCSNKSCQICSREEQEGDARLQQFAEKKKSTLEKGSTGEREVHLGCSAFPAQGMSLGVPQLREEPGQR